LIWVYCGEEWGFVGIEGQKGLQEVMVYGIIGVKNEIHA
jgi:hypothetical protein